MGEASIIFLYAFPAVLIAALAEGLWLSRARGETYDWREWATSLGDLLGRRLLTIIPWSLATVPFAWAYEHRLFTLQLDSVWTVALLFIGMEFFYYWYHRLSHTVRWFWNTHSVHHSPNKLNLSAAYRLGWAGRFIGATLFFTPLALLGFEPATILSGLLLNLLYQFWLHATWIPRLGWLEHVLNTPSSHRVHHARNPDYLDANFGGVLIVFDRLFGTYVAERADEPCVYGLVTPVTTYNPILINFQPWIGMAKDVASARSVSEVWHYLFGAPGWRPNGQGLTTAELRAAELRKGDGSWLRTKSVS